MAILNNLYPPQIPTYAPIFLIDSNTVEDECRVYFSISSYNSKSDILNIQVSLTDQNTNQSVLDPNKYPSEIMIIPGIAEDTSVDSDMKYYFRILKSDIKGGAFKINKYYKLQVRFTGIGASAPIGNRLDTWLADNLPYFSEWSTVCLVKGISTPTLAITGLTEGTTVNYTKEFLSINGKLTFKNSAETDFLEACNLKLYSGGGVNLVEEIDLLNQIDIENNAFSTEFKTRIENAKQYKIEATYRTYLGYEKTITYFINAAIATPIWKLGATIAAELDDIEGAASIDFTLTQDDKIYSILILRSSENTNFTYWDQVANLQLIDGLESYNWKDYTCESGKYYKYALQAVDKAGAKSSIIWLEEPILVEFEDIFLIRDNNNLAIRFNPDISSMKHVVQETIITTLGSKYPYIVRAGDVDYRQFPIGGLISFCGEFGGFADTESLFETEESRKLHVNNNEQLRRWNNVILEKKYRDRVSKYLRENTVKLFRSATEGNILVKLTDINFTPNPTLGRHIYSFSATATEIADCTFENLYKYGIVSKEAIKYYDKDYVLLAKRTDDANYTAIVNPNRVALADQVLFLKEKKIYQFAKDLDEGV